MDQSFYPKKWISNRKNHDLIKSKSKNVLHTKQVGKIWPRSIRVFEQKSRIKNLQVIYTRNTTSFIHHNVVFLVCFENYYTLAETRDLTRIIFRNAHAFRKRKKKTSDLINKLSWYSSKTYYHYYKCK